MFWTDLGSETVRRDQSRHPLGIGTSPAAFTGNAKFRDDIVRCRDSHAISLIIVVMDKAKVQFRPQGMLDYYLGRLRPFLMYRNAELVQEWDDAQEKYGAWYGACTGPEPNPSGQLE